MKFEQEKLTEEHALNKGGNTVKLSKGFVNYQLEGAKESDLCVLIHGLTIPSFAWDKTLPFLENQGYQVLRYDLYGSKEPSKALKTLLSGFYNINITKKRLVLVEKIQTNTHQR